MTWLKDRIGTSKPVIAMAHLLPLPGARLYDADGGIPAIVDHVARDIEALQAGGVDAIMFGNEGDRPYLLEASPESLAAMAAVMAAAIGGLLMLGRWLLPGMLPAAADAANVLAPFA